MQSPVTAWFGMWASTTTLARSGCGCASSLQCMLSTGLLNGLGRGAGLDLGGQYSVFVGCRLYFVHTDTGGAKKKGSRPGACREYAVAAVAPRSFDPRLQRRTNVVPLCDCECVRGEVRCGAVRCGCGAVRYPSTKAVNHQMAMHTDAEG
ncbi:hypothetical protein BDP67DRAFT_507380 [Colletotrichum lupini]|nr:hypothetical protein BDP67DRAFT_507380 [Colletotrichum lupini]